MSGIDETRVQEYQARFRALVRFLGPMNNVASRYRPAFSRLGLTLSTRHVLAAAMQEPERDWGDPGAALEAEVRALFERAGALAGAAAWRGGSEAERWRAILNYGNYGDGGGDARGGDEFEARLRFLAEYAPLVPGAPSTNGRPAAGAQFPASWSHGKLFAMGDAADGNEYGDGGAPPAPPTGPGGAPPAPPAPPAGPDGGEPAAAPTGPGAAPGGGPGGAPGGGDDGGDGDGDPPAPPQPTAVDYNFIRGAEGGQATDAYVPAHDPRDRSGVTVGTGFDIGQHNAADLNALNIDQALRDRLQPYTGLTGQDARDAITRAPLTLTPDEANQLDQAVRTRNETQVSTAYDSTSTVNFNQLPAQAQTVIMSVAHQYGTNLAHATPHFWTAVTNQDWPAVEHELRNFGDHFPTRRNQEADLIHQLVPPPPNPNTPR